MDQSGQLYSLHVNQTHKTEIPNKAIDDPPNVQIANEKTVVKLCLLYFLMYMLQHQTLGLAH